MKTLKFNEFITESKSLPDVKIGDTVRVSIQRRVRDLGFDIAKYNNKRGKVVGISINQGGYDEWYKGVTSTSQIKQSWLRDNDWERIELEVEFGKNNVIHVPIKYIGGINESEEI